MGYIQERLRVLEPGDSLGRVRKRNHLASLSCPVIGVQHHSAAALCTGSELRAYFLY